MTWDRLRGQEIVGGTVSYAALAATKLGWEVAVLTAAGLDFDAGSALPGIPVFVHRGTATTRFDTFYDDDGTRTQVLAARADPVELTPLPDAWRDPDVLLLGPVAGELGPGMATAFTAGVVGAIGQGWVRGVDRDGTVVAREWAQPAADLAGVHALFLSEHDLPDAHGRARALLASVPIVTVTRGWEGASLYTRDGVQQIAALPRQEVDATGAGDVFATAFLLRYHERADVAEAGAFAACAASCVVEGVGTTSLGDRDEVLRRIELRRRLIEEGDWDE